MLSQCGLDIYSGLRDDSLRQKILISRDYAPLAAENKYSANERNIKRWKYITGN
jgi:hypothetical protein